MAGEIVIKLPKKPKASNETQTLPNNPAKASKSDFKLPGNQAFVLIPFIDKISIIIDVPIGDDAVSIHQSIWTTLKNPQLFKEGKKWGQFSVSKRVVLPFIIDSKKWPVLQYRHESGYAKQLRLEFSPVDLGSSGLDDLHVALVTLIPDGWPFVLQNGRITGIEVSVDVPKVDINDFNVMPQQVTTARSWSTGGKLETLVLGKSKGNQTKLYNRAAKRKAKGQTSPHYEGTRIERRLRLVHNLPLIKLPSMPNPFLGLKMVALPPSKPPNELKSYLWEMFMDSVAQRSLPVALKLLPPEKRTLYRAWLAQYPVGWWDPVAIWSHWPEYLKKSGLLGM